MTTQKAMQPLSVPSAWPNANARLLGLGIGLPISPLNRLAYFSPAEFERFTLEWASAYLPMTSPPPHEVQQRGGAGDKGRDVIVWLDPPSVTSRRWICYQCKHYESKIGPSTAIVEIAKLIYYTFIGDYSCPIEYWFVTHKGVTSSLQDLIDDPLSLQSFILAHWDAKCSNSIIKGSIPLSPPLKAYILRYNFSVFRVKQPLDLLSEHAKTRYHLPVFGLPLIERLPPPTPPSKVAPREAGYISQLHEVIGEAMGISVTSQNAFSGNKSFSVLFDRARITFYCAEGLKELARDQMAEIAYFETLLDEFCDGLFYTYTAFGMSGLSRLTSTIQAAQTFQLGGHSLAPHVKANDREGICHQMANDNRVRWCDTSDA